MSSKETIQIIFLNGPSSAGKTMLAHALQQELEKPFLHIGLDRIIGMMPNKLNDWEGGKAPLGFWWKETVTETGEVVNAIQKGPFAEKMVQTLREIVVTMAKMGHFIIIDDVAIGKEAVEAWRVALQGFNVLFVGVRAPLSVLEERERQREGRIGGSAKHQFFTVHEDVSYDLDIDTSELSIDESVSKIQESLQQI